MDRNYGLAVVLGALCVTGCASTHTSDARTQEEKVADFREDVRDYERLQKAQSTRELESEGDKRTKESLGEPGQVEKLVLPE